MKFKFNDKDLKPLTREYQNMKEKEKIDGR